MSTGRPPAITPAVAARIDWSQSFSQISRDTGASMLSVRKLGAKLGVEKKPGRVAPAPPPPNTPAPDLTPATALPTCPLEYTGVRSSVTHTAQRARLEAAGWTAKGINWINPHTGHEHSHPVALMLAKEQNNPSVGA